MRMELIRFQSGSPRPAALWVMIGAALLAAAAGPALASAGWLGVSVQDLSPALREAMDLGSDHGALVSDVVAGSPAEVAGVRPRDLITMVNGREIQSADDLVRSLSGGSAGDQVSIHVIRGGKQIEIPVTLGERDEDEGPALSSPRSPTPKPQPFRDLEKNDEGAPPAAILRGSRASLGVRVFALDRNLAPYFRSEPGRGVLVLAVVPGSAADAAGVRSGDVIVGVDGRSVTDPVSLREIVRSIDSRREVRLDLLREGRETRLQAMIQPDGVRSEGRPQVPSEPARPYSPGKGWSQKREMVWGHRQLDRIER